MAGTFIEGVSQVLSGVYTLIKAAVQSVTLGSRGTIAYPFTSDWGPINVMKSFEMDQNGFKTMYNADKTALTAAKVYKHAYNGRPRKVMGYRMATGAATKGEVSLPAAAGAALVLETLYPSDRPFVAVVADGVSGGKVLDIVENGVKRYSAEGATLAALEASINASDFVRVKSKGTNVPSNTAGVNFAGGNNGSVVTATEYAAFLDILEAELTADAMALDGVVDEGILATTEAWVKRVRSEGFYLTFVRGGASAWDTSIGDANTKSLALNHRGIVNVGNGVDGYSAAEMAIFIAARVGSVALNRTLTDETTSYLLVNKKLKRSERISCKQSGTLVFIQKGNYAVIDEGVNTLTTPIDENERKEMGKIRVNNALDFIARDLEAFGDEYKKTKSNTAEARETYAAAVETDYLAPLQTLEVIQPGYFYRPDPDHHSDTATYPAKIDEAFFYADLTPVDSMERIYQKLNVNF